MIIRSILVPTPMVNKPHPLPDADFALSGLYVLRLSGRDALAFAQAQFMNDVSALADGQWQWSGWLTPKGRLVALFALLRRDAQTLDLVLHDGDPAVFADALKRFVFRSKVTIAMAGTTATGRFAAPAVAQGARAAFDGEATELDLGVPSQPRTLRLQPVVPDAATTPAADAAPQAEADAHWRAIDLAHGLPRLAASEFDRWTPQQLSLDRLRAYSVKKGCYPGQEIVARTHFLGQSKRGLVALHGAHTAQAGHDVAADGASVGRIVALSTQVQLAVLPLDLGPASLTVDAYPVTAVPLCDGLLR
ncbi:folate-binding protein [Luteimonas sp. S4-F44]|uniref:CAF17-like 4Fe-4S cluster assembly/insertion protein YgfZ n=1 Tax=Luteimonas sp. S4-F44 TaxID=2925842 RepID=UPI001F5324FB|nr:folate-binding protein [Luteimonas sp. S4-F44]UNK41117.1 folate-binding protein [Luteimonas sp. S4-F44]